jgi:Origin recognition complex (ORC) subunit 5 C-terminus
VSDGGRCNHGHRLPIPEKTKDELSTPEAKARAYVASFEMPFRIRPLNFRLFLDDIERLARFDREGNLIAAFYTLHMSTRRPISIYGTSCAGAFVRSMVALLPHQPYSVTFLPANFAESAKLFKAVTKALPVPRLGLQDSTLFAQFAELMCRSLGSRLGYNLKDLSLIINASFPAFTLPILRGEVQPRQGHTNMRDLFDRFRQMYLSVRSRAYFRDGFPSITTVAHLPPSTSDTSSSSGLIIASNRMHSAGRAKESSSASSLAMHIDDTGSAAASSSDAGAGKPAVTKPLFTAEVPALAAELHLSRMGRFFLLASFLASHNPESSDKRFFSVRQTGRNVVPGPAGMERIARAKERRMLQGPQTASFERIYAIFISLLSSCRDDAYDVDRDAKDFVHPEVDLQLQISTMAALGYVERSSVHVGKAGLESGETRFTCHLSWDLALKLANGLRLHLANYIWDPAT